MQEIIIIKSISFARAGGHSGENLKRHFLFVFLWRHMHDEENLNEKLCCEFGWKKRHAFVDLKERLFVIFTCAQTRRRTIYEEEFVVMFNRIRSLYCRCSFLSMRSFGNCFIEMHVEYFWNGRATCVRWGKHYVWVGNGSQKACAISRSVYLVFIVMNRRYVILS